MYCNSDFDEGTVEYLGLQFRVCAYSVSNAVAVAVVEVGVVVVLLLLFIIGRRARGVVEVMAD